MTPTSDCADFLPSACNIHLGECIHDENTHFNAYKNTAPGPLFKTSQLPSNQVCFEGVEVKPGPVYRFYHAKKHKIAAGMSKRVGIFLHAHVGEGGSVQGDFHHGLLISPLH